jgi:predicted HTH domain antitoxin
MPKVTIDVNRSSLQGLSLKDEKVLHSIFEMGLNQYRIEQALSLYRHGGMSIGYAARLAGITEREMVRQAAVHGVAPKFSERTVEEDLKE